MSNVTGINEEKSEFTFDFSAARMNELFHEVENLENVESRITQIKRTDILSGANLNTLDMGESSTSSDYKLFVSTAKATTQTLLNLPPNFPYNGFSLEYMRIAGQQWCQRITGATYSASGNVTSVTIYYRAGVGQQPAVTWGGWFMLSPTPCAEATIVEEVSADE